jgi:glycosyltransferase involved in cell wall biosynthesis
LKLYEYLAAGKPVVSKPLPGLADFGGLVSFARTADEWIDAIDAAIRTDTPDLVTARQEIARRHTWDDRVATIERLIADRLRDTHSTTRHGH